MGVRGQGYKHTQNAAGIVKIFFFTQNAFLLLILITPPPPLPPWASIFNPTLQMKKN